MASIEEHKKAIAAFEKEIKQKIMQNELIEQQKIIGFATSEGSANCMALLLRKKELVPSGFEINHRWFASERIAQQHLPFDFPAKSDLLSNLVRQEALRTKLCYGKEKPLREVQEAIKLFFDLKQKVEEAVNEK